MYLFMGNAVILNIHFDCIMFHFGAVLVLLYDCTTWILMKSSEKKLDSDCTRMVYVVLNKSWNTTSQNSSCMVTYFLSHKLYKPEKSE